jgi:hypothetical protein
MTPRALGHLRTAATLVVLSLLVVFAVTRGLSSVSKPFPKSEDPPICVDELLEEGDVLRPANVTVSVVNAGTRSGAARAALDALVEQGFAQGQVSNQPDNAIATSQIWITGDRRAAVRLVRSHLGGRVEVVERESTVAGITVVIGNEFSGVRSGRGQVKIATESTVCSPPALS